VGSPARKMVNLNIEETSGVDHPAHLHEGWLVMKAASPGAVAKKTEEILMKAEEREVEKAENEKPSYEDLMKMLEEANERIAKMEKENMPYKAKEEEDVMKSAPESVRKAFEDMQKSVEEANAKADAADSELRKERDERADAESVLKASAAYSNLGLDPKVVGPALRLLSETNVDLAKSVEDALTSADAKVESADIFSEIGRTAHPAGSALEKAESMAKSAVADGTSATYEQALSEVFISDSELYNSYLNEQGA